MIKNKPINTILIALVIVNIAYYCKPIHSKIDSMVSNFSGNWYSIVKRNNNQVILEKRKSIRKLLLTGRLPAVDNATLASNAIYIGVTHNDN